MTAARTEQTLRDWLVEREKQAEMERDSFYDRHYSDVNEFANGWIEAFREVLAELDRREAVPPVTTLDGVFVADPAGLWAFIDNAIGWIPVDPEDREAMRQSARKMLGMEPI